jgi:hypothetical protein
VETSTKWLRIFGEKMKLTFVLGAAALVGLANAQLIPNIGAESSGLNTAFRNAARTYQVYYDASTFGLTAPATLNGFQLRLSVAGNTAIPSTWPSQVLNFADYTVELAKPSSAFLTDGEYLSGTTAFSYAQAAGTNTVVRSGALSVATSSFAQDGAGGANSWGPTVTFNTNYVLGVGEGLILTIRHTGYTPGTEPQPFFANGTFANGVTDAISSTAGNTATAASGFSSPYNIRFTTSTVPEPASFAVLGLGVLLIARRKRSK